MLRHAPSGQSPTTMGLHLWFARGAQGGLRIAREPALRCRELGAFGFLLTPTDERCRVWPMTRSFYGRTEPTQTTESFGTPHDASAPMVPFGASLRALPSGNANARGGPALSESCTWQPAAHLRVWLFGPGPTLGCGPWAAPSGAVQWVALRSGPARSTPTPCDKDGAGGSPICPAGTALFGASEAQLETGRLSGRNGTSRWSTHGEASLYGSTTGPFGARSKTLARARRRCCTTPVVVLKQPTPPQCIPSGGCKHLRVFIFGCCGFLPHGTFG